MSELRTLLVKGREELEIGTPYVMLIRCDRHKLLIPDRPIRSIWTQLILVGRRRGNKPSLVNSQMKFNMDAGVSGRSELARTMTCAKSR